MPEVTCSQCGGGNPAGFKFCGHCGAAMNAGPALARAAAVPQAAPAHDERRQVTVLFADVSGFTDMSSRMDAEDIHALMNEVFAGLGKAIRDEGGHIDKYVGDNVMALFGAPTAHEDDPARACRAALDMQAFLRDFAAEARQRHGVQLAMRIGINDGLVVAGAVGSDLKQQYSVMGDSVNVASRLESEAQPGTVLVSQQVQRRAAAQFTFGPSQLLQVKGKDEPVVAHQLLGERTAEVAATEAAEHAWPLVGRHRELADLEALLGCWSVIEVRGERGIGKARLVHEAVRRRGGRLLTVTPTAATARRPLGLIRRIVQAIVLHRSKDLAAVQGREAFAAAVGTLRDDLRDYIGALWYVAAASAAAPEPPDSDPLMLRRTIEQGVEQLLAALAAAEPDVVLFLRERQVADEASAQWLARIAAPGVAALTMVVSCSEADAARLATPHVLTLGPLGDADAEELLKLLLCGAALPAAVRHDLLRRAAGVPLFLEQLAQALIDQGAVRRDADGTCTWQGAAASGLELPASLRSAMLSRVDHLAQAERELLYQASVQGVEFDLDVCESVRRAPRWSGPSVEPLVALLDGRQIVTTAAAPLAARRRSFRQELMQQVCYETLLKRDRRELHALTADALRERHRDAAVAAEALAYHEERAERFDRAADAMLHAAEQAADVYLNEAALARFEQAVGFAQQAGVQDSSMRRLVALAHCGAARVHLLLGDYEKARHHAGEMAQAAVSPAQLAESKRLRAEVAARTKAPEEALGLLQEVVSELGADSCGELDVLSHAWADLALLHHRAGRLDEALACVGRSRAAICSSPRLSGIQADLLEGAILQTRGDFDQAQRLYERAAAAAGEIASLSHVARAANGLGNCARDRGAYEDARRWYEQAMEVWGRMCNTECIAGACTNLGNVAMSVGAVDDAEQRYRQAMQTWEKIGNVRGTVLARANLAILALERGDGEAAVTEADEALRLLGTGADAVLRSLVQVVREEGVITCGGAAEAEKRLWQMLDDPGAQPLVVAGVRRALGRAAEQCGQLADARRHYEAAIGGFEQLRRTQETARTRLLLTNVLGQMQMSGEAQRQIDAAVEELEQSAARHDLERARRLQQQVRQDAAIRSRS